ncbi:dihydroorotase [Flavisolibacter ginsenosidimutans]|uniref:Dihydroorotase n=1 Tax=Flavisolibacter ginsenosidimutans TaxID=661481 RepID=A0A5B8UI59_9BACT|nr:dihydroorotase [Flavisolibacter ginsenosidimutans]QEC55859.1 dihydroorotase [Flavisolibacter ginsenosidimutans]
MQNYLIKNIQVVNENKIEAADVWIADERIKKIAPRITLNTHCTEINGEGKYLLPGAIDDQVHFRDPGLTQKATIYTEARAAVAGGVTSFMEMPNTVPPALRQDLLEEKYGIASQSSVANYSFFMGTSNNNADEVLRTNEKKKDICGVKIFMGASTGNLLVDNYLTIDKIFRESEVLIATHCEEESIIKDNYHRLKAEKGDLSPSDHPLVRNEEACFESSFKAVQLAKKHNTRLHILHISTEKELQLFTNLFPLKEKRITAEVCVHHLHFTSNDYATFGYKIKCNPAIKAPYNKEALWAALLDDRLDVIATDHAPHLLSEKEPPYEHAHAGLPLVQHPLLLMLYYHKQGKISLQKIVQKMSHAVADCFQIAERGYIREGYFADLVMVDLNESTTVSKEELFYKCGWSPLEGFTFPASITHTFVNGNLVYENGAVNDSYKGARLVFDR